MELSRDTTDNLKRLAQEVCEREGCRLYQLEFAGGRHRILRVFIDKLDGSASLTDCENVSRSLNLLLDVEDLIPGGAYDLEVSTPGLERKLTETWHFENVIDQTVNVKTSDPIDVPEGYTGKGKEFRQITGTLKSVSETELRVERDNVEWQISRNLITKAQLVFMPVPKGEKNKPKKKR